MTWETLPERVHRSRTSWGVSISKNGGITIWMPHGHALAKSSHVITQTGKGDHAGWIRIVPSTTGRKVMVPVKGKETEHTARFLKYSTLPGAPIELKMTELQVRPEDGGAVAIKLPWRVPGAPFSMDLPARAGVGR